MDMESPMKKSYGHKILKLWRTITSIRESTVIFMIISIAFVISSLSPHFLSQDNLMTTAISLSAEGIITVGMTIALVSGGFDFSVGSVMSLSAVTAGVVYRNGINIWAACVIALIIGMLCGLINGFFIGRIGLNPFITTLAVMQIARGASFVLTQGSPISLFGVSKTFLFLGQGSIFGMPFIVAVFIIIAAIGDFMMRRSEPLRRVFYTGSNEKSATLSGVNTSRVKMGVYLLIGALSSIAGILTLARFSVAAPTAGLGLDTGMRSISAAVIGGASLSGGEGTILGSVLGIILLNIINNGLNLLNVPVYWQDFINGVILITAVSVDFVSHKNRIRYFKSKSNV